MVPQRYRKCHMVISGKVNLTGVVGAVEMVTLKYEKEGGYSKSIPRQQRKRLAAAEVKSAAVHASGAQWHGGPVWVNMEGATTLGEATLGRHLGKTIKTLGQE